MKIGQEVLFQSGNVPPILVGIKFVIAEINTYSFINAKNLVCTITSDLLPPLFLSCFDGFAAISRELSFEEIKVLFDIDDFVKLLGDGNTSVECRGSVDGWEDWFDCKYCFDSQYKVGRYYKGRDDYEGRRVVHYTLTGNNCSIDVEMFEDCKVLFYVTVYDSQQSVFFGI